MFIVESDCLSFIHPDCACVLIIHFTIVGPSLQVIEDELNMIGFFKEPDDMVLGLADDSDYSLSDYGGEEIMSEDDEEIENGSDSGPSL